jgi:hypothetical protein
MASIDVSVAIDDANLTRFDAVVRQARRAGLRTNQVLKEIGVVTGSIEADKLPALRKVKGIASVEINRDIQLPPPESDTQ